MSAKRKRVRMPAPEKLLWSVTSNKVPPHFSNPPGYLPVAMNVQLARGAHNVVSAYGTKQATVDGAIEAGTLFAGAPDQVLGQIKRHWEHVGGYGHLLIMGQAGFLEHEDTVHGIRMFAREVYPRLKEIYPDALPSSAREPASHELNPILDSLNDRLQNVSPHPLSDACDELMKKVACDTNCPTDEETCISLISRRRGRGICVFEEAGLPHNEQVSVS